MKLRKLLRGAPAAGEEPRRRRRPRPDAPRTIIPIGDDARPSWLPTDAPVAPPARPARPTSLAVGLDAARERLRREIPPVDDDVA